jgi:HNH endonuclease
MMAMIVENPPSFIVRTEAQKAAWDNGYRLERGNEGGWLHYASTTALDPIWIAGVSGVGPWLLSVNHTGVAAEIGSLSVSPAPGPGLATFLIQRIGQDIFRNALIDYWSGRCPMTGITEGALLRASHIKPWADCSDAERLDVHNGLLLSALWDAAFDRGLVSFADNGCVLVSPRLGEKEREALGHTRAISLQGLRDAHRVNLSFHRNRYGF